LTTKKNSKKVVEALDPEEGLILEEKEKKIAIFKDDLTYWKQKFKKTFKQLF
jgi:hypothetical protein